MVPKKKLIYAEDLQEAFCNTFYPEELRKLIYFGGRTHKLVSFFGRKSKELIENAPVVDAVEVVRCKDCKHQTTGLCPMENVDVPWVGTKDDDFCSFGERKSDG